MKNKHIFTAVYCLSYICVAFVAAGLGPLIPIKAQQIGLPPTEFKWAFVFKGAGCIIGTLLGLKIQQLISLHRAMAIAYLLVGVSSLIAFEATNIFIFEAMFLVVEFCKMLINVCTTVCILRSQKKQGEAWLKTFHFSYGIGAFTSPLIIKSMKISAFFVYSATVIPTTLFMLLTKAKIDKPIIAQNMINEGQITMTSSGNQIQDTKATTTLRFDLLLAAFLFFTTGNQGAFAGWLTSYGKMDNRLPIDTVLTGQSIYWISMTVGRGLVIPLSLVWSNNRQLKVLITGIFLTVLMCNLFSWFQFYSLVMYVGSALMGLFMSGVYPLTMSMPSSLKLRTSSKNTSVYAMGGCFGTICIPFVVGVVMEHFGPNSLFICMQIIAIAMVGEFIIMNIQRKKLLERKTEEIDSLISSRAPTDEL